MTIEYLYKQRPMTAVIDNNSKDMTTNGKKLLNSDRYYKSNNVDSDSSKKDVNDTLISCCEDFFKYCCICTVRKRKSVGVISPMPNSIRYRIENPTKILSVPIVKFNRTLPNEVV